MIYFIIAYLAIGAVLAIHIRYTTIPPERWNTPFFTVIYGWIFYILLAVYDRIKGLANKPPATPAPADYSEEVTDEQMEALREMTRLENCTRCSGSGRHPREDGKVMVYCFKCNGTGKAANSRPGGSDETE